MSKQVLTQIKKRTCAIISCCIFIFLFASCDANNQITPENNYQVDVVSSAEGDIPVGTPMEIVLGFKEFSAKVQQLSFQFPSGLVALTVDGTPVVSGQRAPVVLEGTALVKLHATGLKAGTHKITVRAENGSATASCVVSLSVSDRVYRVEVVENPTLPLTLGWHDAFTLKVIDEQNKNHLFYQTPGYNISARSLDNAFSIIELGITEVWNNVPDSVAVEGHIPLNWAFNEGIMMYRAFTVGEHKIEFTVTAPDGATSRTVLTIPVNSSKVVLTPRQTPKTKLSVTETHDATFNVAYLGHPKNRVALMWEELPAGDPYGVAPDVTIDFVRPKAGEWGEFKYAREIGATTYPLPPAKAGNKQGFRLHVKDMYGWQQSFDYRFEVTSSEFTVSLVKSTTPYVQNMLNWVKLRIEDYPANSTFRYKLVPAKSGYESVVFNEKQYDTWYEVNLAGGKGEPYEISMFFAYGCFYWANGSFSVVVEDKYGVENTATFFQMFERNEIAVTADRNYLTATVGTPVTWNCTLNATKTDQHTYKNVKWTSPDLDLQAGTLKVNNISFAIPAGESMPHAVVLGDNRVVQMSYTPTTVGVQEIHINPMSWCNVRLPALNDGTPTTVVRINVIPSGGSFAITPDKTLYEIPYSDARVHQDITVTLASGNESAGLYDWNDTYKIGTSVYYSSNGSMGRLVALDAQGREVAIAAKSTVPLKYAVGNTLRLRHYPAQVNDGSIERIALTVTRKDGTTATDTVTVDAEDKGFELVEEQAWWTNPYPKVGAKFGVPFSVVNRSKYYRGTYQLKSYKIQDNKAVIVPSDEVPPIQNIPLNGERGIELHFIASSAGMTTLKELIIQDDFGRGVTYTNTGFAFIVVD